LIIKTNNLIITNYHSNRQEDVPLRCIISVGCDHSKTIVEPLPSG